jgi:hypothetical protein
VAEVRVIGTGPGLIVFSSSGAFFFLVGMISPGDSHAFFKFSIPVDYPGGF